MGFGDLFAMNSAGAMDPKGSMLISLLATLGKNFGDASGSDLMKGFSNSVAGIDSTRLKVDKYKNSFANPYLKEVPGSEINPLGTTKEPVINTPPASTGLAQTPLDQGLVPTGSIINTNTPKEPKIEGLGDVDLEKLFSIHSDPNKPATSVSTDGKTHKFKGLGYNFSVTPDEMGQGFQSESSAPMTPSTSGAEETQATTQATTPTNLTPQAFLSGQEGTDRVTQALKDMGPAAYFMNPDDIDKAYAIQAVKDTQTRKDLADALALSQGQAKGNLEERKFEFEKNKFNSEQNWKLTGEYQKQDFERQMINSELPEGVPPISRAEFGMMEDSYKKWTQYRIDQTNRKQSFKSFRDYIKENLTFARNPDYSGQLGLYLAKVEGEKEISNKFDIRDTKWMAQFDKQFDDYVATEKNLKLMVPQLSPDERTINVGTEKKPIMQSYNEYRNIWIKNKITSDLNAKYPGVKVIGIPPVVGSNKRTVIWYDKNDNELTRRSF